jgi:hypothetical protein
MPTCLEVFCSSGFEGRPLQIHVDQCFPDFACESEKCSPHSPGPVQNDETVAFLLINPLHFDEQRKVVVPDAFQELTNRDLSVLRIRHARKRDATATREELIERGKERVPPQLRLVDEVCIGNVSELRAAIAGYGRLIGVFDTALEEKPSHASLFTREAALEDRRLRKVVRNRVHEVMTRHREAFGDLHGRLPN